MHASAIAAMSTLQLIDSPQWHKANDQNSNDAMKNFMSAKINVLVRQRTKTCAGVNDGDKTYAPDGSKTPPGLQGDAGYRQTTRRMGRRSFNDIALNYRRLWCK
jgi:hypothetical protein